MTFTFTGPRHRLWRHLSRLPLSQLHRPPPIYVMTRVRNFIRDVLRAGKSVKEAKKMVDDVFGENSLKMRAIYDMLKLVKAGENTDDKRRLNARKTTKTDDLVAATP